MKEKKLILCVVIVFLAVAPFVVRHFHSRQVVTLDDGRARITKEEIDRYKKESKKRVEIAAKKYEKKVAELVHGSRLKNTISMAPMTIVPIPDDLHSFSKTSISSNSAKIAIAGVSGSSQIIYVADFPPKNESDSKKVLAFPESIAIDSIKWNDFVPNIIGVISIEMQKKDDASGTFDYEKYRQIYFYSIDVSNGAVIKKIYLCDRNPAEAGTAHTSLCWEQSDNILLLKELDLMRISTSGEIEHVSKLDFPFELCQMFRIVSENYGTALLFGSELLDENVLLKGNTTNKETSLELWGQLPYLSRINVETKEMQNTPFCEPIEFSPSIFSLSNGSRLLCYWNQYDNKFRFLVVDTDKKSERVFVEVPKGEYEGMYLADMTPDGRYGVCILSRLGGAAAAEAYQTAISRGLKLPRAWDKIGLFALP